MITPAHRAERSQSTFPTQFNEARVSSTLKQIDTLAASGEKSAWAGLGQLVLDILLKGWEWIKYNLLFCFFDEGEEARLKFIEELEAFVNKTPFGQQDPDQKVELEDQEKQDQHREPSSTQPGFHQLISNN